MVRVAPTATVPNAHGNAVVQSPVLLTKVRPAGGVGFSTATPAASLGPLLPNVMVYTTFWPATTEAGPLMATDRSTEAPTPLLTLALLLPGEGSVVALLAVAVFTRGSGLV